MGERFNVFCSDRRGPRVQKSGKIHHAQWSHGSMTREEADECAARLRTLPSFAHIDIAIVPLD